MPFCLFYASFKDFTSHLSFLLWMVLLPFMVNFSNILFFDLVLMEVLFLMLMYDRPLFVSGAQVEKAHNEDLHCVDWNSHDQNFILTGYF